MGKLRDILSRFIKYKPDSNLPTPICTHTSLPQKQQHTKLIANSLDHCHSHNQKMCLVCSDVHIQNHCYIDLRVNKDLGEGTLKDFNLGHMMMLSLNGLKCICGQPLNHNPNHAICAACGLASCSQQCHEEWQQMGNCTYHLNYYQKPKNITMRSIIFNNIKNIQKAKINQWNLACKSSLSYIACYAKNGANYVFLQRGYRNYGVPQPQLIEKMKKMDFGLDFTTHIERVCSCTCDSCTQRGFHSVGNCEYDCHEVADFNSNKYVDNTQIYKECSCDCPFCVSGVVVTRHTRFECSPHCLKSHYNSSNLTL